MLVYRRQRTSSFYESFSDLIFCTLVLFLGLLLFLLLSIDQRVESVRVAERAVATQNQDLETQRLGVLQAEEELERQRSVVEIERKELAAVEGQIRERRNAAERLLGRSRFIAAPTLSVWNLMIDARGHEPRYWPVPDNLVRSFTSDVVGESADMAAERRRAILMGVDEIVRNVRPLTAAEIAEVDAHLSWYWSGTDPTTRSQAGFGARVMPSKFNGVTALYILAVAPGSTAECAIGGPASGRYRC